MVLQSNTSRDSDIFNAIEKVFASDALKYGSVVEALAKAFRSDTQNYDTVVIDLYQSLSQDDGVAVDLDAWFGNWKYIKEKVIRLERFASRLSESHKDRDYQPVIDFSKSLPT